MKNRKLVIALLAGAVLALTQAGHAKPKLVQSPAAEQANLAAEIPTQNQAAEQEVSEQKISNSSPLRIPVGSTFTLGLPESLSYAGRFFGTPQINPEMITCEETYSEPTHNNNNNNSQSAPEYRTHTFSFKALAKGRTTIVIPRMIRAGFLPPHMGGKYPQEGQFSLEVIIE